VAESFVEIGGKLEIEAPYAAFTLTAKADRIDRRSDGNLEIIDYKTGAPPSRSAVEHGFAPQLPLEAAIAAAGGFRGLQPASVGALTYWRLTGGTPPGEVLAASQGDPAPLAEAALAGLARLVAAFDDPATPYACQPRPERAPRFNDYDHLSRIAEWSAGSDSE
jgi:ATP-dependent helicase/nuclease subunit B